MTDEQIVKALECCFVNRTCRGCPLDECVGENCCVKVRKEVLDLINRQKAEIGRLKSDNDILSKNLHNLSKELEAEKIRNF